MHCGARRRGEDGLVDVPVRTHLRYWSLRGRPRRGSRRPQRSVRHRCSRISRCEWLRPGVVSLVLSPRWHALQLQRSRNEGGHRNHSGERQFGEDHRRLAHQPFSASGARGGRAGASPWAADEGGRTDSQEQHHGNVRQRPRARKDASLERPLDVVDAVSSTRSFEDLK